MTMNTRVRLATALGDIDIELFDELAPIGSCNFLAYVAQGLLARASFYRAMRREHWTPGRELSLIQGGLAGTDGPALPPIPHESPAATGLRHLRGTVSYARAAPGTAGSEFFICTEDCPGLDARPDPTPPADGLGYAVFGRVVGGMAVVEAIQAGRTGDAAPSPLLRGQMLEQPVRIQGATVLAPAGVNT